MRRADRIADAKAQRRAENSFEAKLWQCLRKRQLANHKFRRQHPIGPYIADFYCAEAKLVVEVDGKHHFTPDGQAHDKTRDAYLARQGLRVLRVRGYEVESDLSTVLQAIRAALVDQAD